MHYFWTMLILFLISSCGGDMQDEKDFQREIYRDNHTYIEIRDNQTVVTTTTTTTTTTDKDSSSTSTVSSNTNGETSSSTETTPSVRMFNDPSYSMTAVNYALGNMPTLTFYVEGDSKRYVMNQNGVTPKTDNFTETETGFFSYTVLKAELELVGADVNVDNTSDITLNYKTNLYGFVQNKDKSKIYNLAPIEYLVKVK